MTADGEMDSDGTFTVDMSRARLKLAEYQLTRFELYADFLLSAGILAGVRSINVVGKPSKVGVAKFATTIYFRGWALTEEDIRALDPISSDTSANPALKNLAIALSTITTKHPVLLKSKGQGEVLSLAVRDGELNAARGLDAKFPEHTTTLRVRFDLTEEIKERFHAHQLWTPVVLNLNKKAFRTGFQFAENAKDALGYYVNGEVHEYLEAESESWPPGMIENVDEMPGLFLVFDSQTEVGFSFIVDGLAYPACKELSELGIGGMAVGRGLSRDLSFTGLVQDKAYATLESQVKKGAAKLVKFLLESGIKPNSKEEAHLRKLLSRLRDELPRTELANRLDQLTANVSPTKNPEAFEILAQKVLNGKVALEAVRDAYLQRVAELRAEGNLKEAITYQEHLLELCQCAGSSVVPAKRLLGSLLLAAGLEPTDSTEDPVLRFHRKIWEWSSNLFNQWEEESEPGGHVTWSVPAKLRPCLEQSDFRALESLLGDADWPDWVRFFAKLGSGKGAEAQEILESSAVLDFRWAKRSWYLLLWSYRGRMPWARVISLRAKLSRELLRDEPGIERARNLLMPSGGLEELDDRDYREKLLSAEFSKPKFLPLFFALVLLDQQRGRSSRATWRRVLGQELCQLLLSGEHDPLGKPLFGNRHLATASSASK